MNDTIEGTIEPTGTAVTVSNTAAQPLAKTPFELLAVAAARGASMDELSKFMDLVDRYEAKQALNAFTAAMAAFKTEAIQIIKSKRVSYPTRGADPTSYSHAELSDVTDAVIPAMAKHQLSHNWRPTQTEKGITVTCVVRHAQGHSEETTLTAGPDTSGSKNAIQAVGSTLSYLERYTLLAAVGLAAKGMDDDGASAGRPRQEKGRERNAEPQRSDEENQAASRMVTDLYSLADQGWEALSVAWKAMSAQQRASIGGEFRKIKARAEAADKAKGQQP
jgi:hypothetical protein